MLLCGMKDALQPGVQKENNNLMRRDANDDDDDHHAAGVMMPITIADERENGDHVILPLGLKPIAASMVVSKTRIGAGGEVVERSRRDVGRLRSRMVGRYSFERIVI